MKIHIFLVILAAFLLNASTYDAKPYTIMIYMNGSDLESEEGLATEDLIEMLESGLKSENANVVIITGGTNYWQNDVIPSSECALWYIEDGEIFFIDKIGLQNMGDPDTLSDFITYAMSHFPADKYALIMWDHGGGAIAGFGHDEKFDDYGEGSLTLMEMDYAFKKAGLCGQALEWLGFDSCLMATVEMAQIASKYARYMIASEDLEPGDGWDYKFLALLNQHPYASGHLIGREIVDTFMDFYGSDSDEILTLSVVDLSRVQAVMDSMGDLMSRCSKKLLLRQDSFTTLAQRRGDTKTFGEGSPRDNESDMVDIGDMAKQLEDLFPEEVAAVFRALNNTVLYNRHNSKTPLYGLSSYYIYGGQFLENLELYAELSIDDAYLLYMEKFLKGLEGYDVSKTPIRRSVIGRPVEMYMVAELQTCSQYAIPAQVNGKNCDIIVCFPQDEILGYRYTGLLAKQKGLFTFEEGDKAAFYYPCNDRWLLGGELPIYDLINKGNFFSRQAS